MSHSNSTSEPGSSATAPPADLLAALRAVRRPLLVGHVTPDADCLGSALALALALRGRGATACFSLPGGAASKRLSFMLDLAGRDLLTDGAVKGHDCIMALDTAGRTRLNASFGNDGFGDRPVLNIDHHLSNTGFGRVNWIDDKACSTSEMVFRLLAALAWPLTPAMASLLYAGIYGDTGGFSLPNTTCDSLHAAAELVRSGADIGAIGEKLCRSQVQADFDLLRRVYDHTVVADGGRIAYSILTHEDIVESGCNAEDIDDQVAVPRSLAGIRIAMLFSEAERGIVRINLRGEGSTSVLPIAQALGGGGHAQSAGVRMRNKPIEQVVAEVVAIAQRHLDQR